MAKAGNAVPVRPGGRPGDHAPFTGSGQPVPARETVRNRIRNIGTAASPGGAR